MYVRDTVCVRGGWDCACVWNARFYATRWRDCQRCSAGNKPIRPYGTAHLGCQVGATDPKNCPCPPGTSYAYLHTKQG